MQELELCSEKVTGERDALRERLNALETSRKELADEYIILKSNYLALGKELDQEVRQAAVLALMFLTPSHIYLIYSQLGCVSTAQLRSSKVLSALRWRSSGMVLFSGLRDFM